MTHPAQYLLHSRVDVTDGQKLPVANRLSGRDRTGPQAHATYAALQGHTVMELTAFESLGALAGVIAARADAERSVTTHLKGEWRHEILCYADAFRETSNTITPAPMIEMRHIEVPPPVYCEYRDWRERTLYAALRDRPEIDDFSAYQSVLSTRPGVTFIVGFSQEPAIYRAAYQTPLYRDILRQANARYIASGQNGLQCQIFVRPETLLTMQETAR
jgi:hypothetical protein